MTISKKWSLPLLLLASALIYIFTIGVSLSAIIPTISCSTVDEAIKTADQAIAGVYNIADTCEIRPIQVPDNPSDLLPIYIAKGDGIIFVIVEAIHEDGMRFSIIQLAIKKKGQAI